MRRIASSGLRWKGLQACAVWAALAMVPAAVHGSGYSISGATLTLSGATEFFTEGDLTITKGSLVAAASTMTIGGSWNNSGGSFSLGASTVVLSGAAPGRIIQSRGSSFYRLVISGPADWTTVSTTTVRGTVDVSAGAQLNLTTDLLLNGGSFTNAGTINSVSTATLILNGAGALGGAGTTILPRMTLQGAGQTTALAGPIVVLGSMTISANHTLDANNAGNYQIQISSDWVNLGTFSATGGEVAFIGTATLTGQTTFYNLAAATPGITLFFPAGSTQTVTNTLQITGSLANPVRLRSSVNNNRFFLKLGPSGTDAIYSVDVKDSQASGQTLVAAASSNQGNNINWIFGTTRAWVGPGNWSAAANWSPPGVPGESDTVNFTNSSNCAIDITTTVALVTIQAGYTGAITANQDLTISGGFVQYNGTFNAGGRTLTVGSSWLATGGTFNPSTGTVVLNSQSPGRSLQTHKQSFYNLTFQGVGGYWTLLDSMTVISTITIAAGTLDTNAASDFGISAGGPWLGNGGSFIANGSTVAFAGAGAALSVDSGGSPFYSLTFSGSRIWQAMSGSLTAAGNVTIGSGAGLQVNTDFSVQGGSLTNNGTLTMISTATLTLSGSGTLGGTGTTLLPSVILGGAGQTTTLGGPVTIQGSLTNAPGHTLDANGAGNYAMTISSSWSNLGTYLARAGSITFNGAGSGQTIDPGVSAFYKLAFTGSGDWSAANNPLTVSSTVVLNSGALTLTSASSMTIGGSLSLGSAGILTMNADLGVGDSLLNAGTISAGPATTLTLSGNGLFGGAGSAQWPNLVMNGPGTTTLASALVLNGNIMINSGHALDMSASNYPVTLQGSWSNAGTYLMRAGSVTFTGSSAGLTIDSGGSPFYQLAFTGGGSWQPVNKPITVSGDVMLANGTLTVIAGSTVTVGGNLNIQAGALLDIENDLGIGGGSLTNTGTIISNSTATLSLRGAGILGGTGSTTLPKLTLSGIGQTTTLGGALILQGGFTNGSGHTLDVDSAGHYTLTVSSDWTNSGILTPRTGTVIFNSTAALAGNTTFYNFTAITGGITLTFLAGSIQTVTGNFFVNGADLDLIRLHSSAGGSQFYIKNTGTADLLYLNVQDSNASANKLNASASTNVSNNTNWTFGTTKKWTGSSSANWSVSNNWNPAGVPGALDSIIFTLPATRNCLVNITTTVAQIILQSDFPVARTLTFSAGVSLTVNGNFTQVAGVVNFNNPVTLTVGGSFALMGGVFTPGNGTLLLNGNSPGQTIQTTGRTLNNIIFNGAGGSWTLQDPMTVLSTVTLTAGTLDTNAASSFGVSVGGDWRNNGGLFAANASTVTFTATTIGRKITSGGESFANIDISGSGAWSPQDPMTLTGDLTLTAGTLNAGAMNIALAGNWTESGGTFTAGTSTVTITGAAGTTSIVTGGASFYGLACNVGGKKIQFDSINPTSVTGALILNGLPGNRLQLRSVNALSPWSLNLTGTQSVSDVDVRDGTASGATIYAGNASQDSGGNTNWIFDYLPAAITNLTATAESDGSVSVSWSAPFDPDDNPLGTGSQYAIQWATYTVAWSTSNTGDTGVEFSTHVYLSTSGVNPGDIQVYISTNQAGNVMYYFRIWTQDPLGYWSSLSNGATVTVTPILSVYFSTHSYDFGPVKMADSIIAGLPIVISNIGNVIQTYSLSVTTTGPTTVWSVGASTPVAMDTFALFGTFHSVQPSSTTFGMEDIIVKSPTPSTPSTYSVGMETGTHVPVDSDRQLWLMLQMPRYTSTIKPQQMDLAVTAMTP